MPGREYTTGDDYRYSINGQEKEAEINENVTSAEFWMYDSRIARRWNIDPVVKVWLSGYSCFRDNPILWIDPDGDDDIFDRKGNYLGSTKKGNAIRVVNASGITFAQATKNLQGTTKLITELTYFPKQLSNRAILVQIMTHYAKEVEINKTIKVVDEESKAAALAFTVQDSKKYKVVAGDYVVFVDPKTGKINKDLRDKYNTVNNFVHEKNHEDDPATRSDPIEHVNAVITQINHHSFVNTTDSHKEGLVEYTKKLLNNALSADEGNLERVKSKIEEFNKNSRINQYGTLYYDEEHKAVGTTGRAVIITAPARKKKTN